MYDADMCFMLFVGTDNPLPLKEWRKDIPDICVQPLSGDEEAVRTHFSKPFVQYVGSTAGCGCDFPHWLLFNGEPPADGFDGRDDDQKQTNTENAKRLVRLLHENGGRVFESYGVWAGNWSKPPLDQKDMQLHEVLSPSFLFGEQVFYRVKGS